MAQKGWAQCDALGGMGSLPWKGGSKSLKVVLRAEIMILYEDLDANIEALVDENKFINLKGYVSSLTKNGFT